VRSAIEASIATLLRQHHRVRPVVDRVGHVGGLRAGRPRGPDHRVEHLRGGDRRARQLAGQAQQLLLRAGDVLDRQLDSEVTAGDHHAVGGADDVLGRVDGLGLLDLGDQGLARVLAHALDVLGRAHEGQRHEVDADLLPELEHFDVLFRNRLQTTGGTGQVQTLSRRDAAGDLDLAVDLSLTFTDTLDAQSDGAVGEVDDVLGVHGGGQTGPGDRHATLIALRSRPGTEGQRLAALQLGDAVGEHADAQLGAGQVLENRHRPADPRGCLTDQSDVLGVALTVTVREVEAGDVKAGLDHAGQHLGVTRGGADRRDDLRTAHLVGLSSHREDNLPRQA
jgi:hypothetical protein